VTVKNTGNITGKEVVQLYTSDLYASITPDVKRLRGFEKIELQPGEDATVSFSLTPESVSFINAQNKRVTEPGEFEVQIAGLKAKFVYAE
ncbi:MAG TPA: fibronectin type III-like domain-contianing protein, partial [Prolixibacteraceae bacterium]|nr:fibronectin type III-like domain-contianing protein [Prolixibacteraceae bacterium]